MIAEHNDDRPTPASVGLDPLAALEALRRAGAMARELALQSDTAVIVRDHGKLLRITADQLRSAQKDQAENA